MAFNITNPSQPLDDAAAARLRAAIAEIELQMTALAEMVESAESRKALAGLHSSWTVFVEVLAVPLPVERRLCPVCNHLGMRDATRCGYCWTKFLASA
jgi:hypothetical protein